MKFSEFNEGDWIALNVLPEQDAVVGIVRHVGTDEMIIDDFAARRRWHITKSELRKVIRLRKPKGFLLIKAALRMDE